MKNKTRPGRSPLPGDTLVTFLVIVRSERVFFKTLRAAEAFVARNGGLIYRADVTLREEVA